jgi:hypothetical protein
VTGRDISNMMPSRSLYLRQAEKERERGFGKREMGRESERNEEKQHNRIFRHILILSLSLSLSLSLKHTHTHTHTLFILSLPLSFISVSLALYFMTLSA